MRNRKAVQKTDGKITGKTMGKVSVFLSMTVLIGLLSGCGSSGEAEDASAWKIVHADTGDEKLPNEGAEEDANLPDGNVTEKQTSAQTVDGDTGSAQAEGGVESFETIYGNVKSIGDDSLIISRAFEEESEEGDVDIMCAPAEGSADEVLTTVIFSENTKFEVHTVKNGGVNGDDDVEKREGTLADIKADAFVDITGSWEDTGFRAEKIVVSYFV